MKTIAVDFETYYDTKYSIKTTTPYYYSQDSKFSAYLVSTFDGEKAIACKPSEYPWESIHNSIWVSHNKSFDEAVFKRLKELNIIPSFVQPLKWYCTRSASAYFQLPLSLNDVYFHLFNVSLDKSIRTSMCGKRYQDFFELPNHILEYAKMDAKACYQVWRKIEKYWPENERKLKQISDDMGDFGVNLDIDYLEKSKIILNQEIQNILDKLPFNPFSPKQFKEMCRLLEIPLPTTTAKTSEDLIVWLSSIPESKRQLTTEWVNMAQNVRSMQRTMKIVEQMLERAKRSGRMKYSLEYFGAHTGRWAGSGGLNVQNFPRDSVSNVDLRRAIIPEKGKKLLICDYAQIEARVLLYLAGDFSTLELIKQGCDIYEAHARITLGYNDPKPLKEVNPSLRKLAKARVLGLGYGCGAKTFKTVAKLMADVNLSIEEAEQAVISYRKSNPKITKLWDALNLEFKKHAGGKWGMPIPGALLGELRRIYYRNINDETMECNIGADRLKFWGGKLTENLVQALSRDILAKAWLNCVEAGYKPILSVHDELVFEIEPDEKIIKTIVEIMKHSHESYLPNLPIDVNFELSDFYKK